MISILTVTYGERWIYLEKVLLKLLCYTEISQIIIVNNGSTYNLKEVVAKIVTEKIFIIDLSSNQGSAAGFKVGLEFALSNLKTEFLWLLDDDNLPDDNCLFNLVNYWDSIKEEQKSRKFALVCLRVNRKYLANIANNGPIEFNFPTGNSFLGLNVFRIHSHFVYLVLRFLNNLRKLKENSNCEFQIPFAPYGGLFLHKDLIGLIGYPNRNYFVYADDFEYTNRIQLLGGKLILLSNCKVSDLETVWHSKMSKCPFVSRYLNQSSFRTYYSTRNSVYFSRKYLVNSNIKYKVNMILFLFAMIFVAILSLSFKRYVFLILAIRDGFRENLDEMA
jgi:GT2 family glycosyltransferase